MGVVSVNPPDGLANRIKVGEDDLHGLVGLGLGADANGLTFAGRRVSDANDGLEAGEDIGD